MNHRIFNISLFIIYIVVATALMIWQGIGIAPDRYAFLLLLASLLVKRTRSFILDWIPFLFILLSYDFLRGFADNLNQRVHFEGLIQAEFFIFGSIPTIELQKALYKPSLSLIDFIAAIFYFLHFALPLVFAYILWIYNRNHFKQFVIGILLLSYAAFFTFLIFPAAPPWLASNEGYLPKVVKIMDQVLEAFPDKWDLPTIYHSFNPNPVAAMPSLHGAYPFLILLFSIQFFKLKGLIFLPYVLLVWFSLVYLGEHYVIDIIAGSIYAVIFYVITTKLNFKYPFKVSS